MGGARSSLALAVQLQYIRIYSTVLVGGVVVGVLYLELTIIVASKLSRHISFSESPSRVDCGSRSLSVMAENYCFCFTHSSFGTDTQLSEK